MTTKAQTTWKLLSIGVLACCLVGATNKPSSPPPSKQASKSKQAKPPTRPRARTKPAQEETLIKPVAPPQRAKTGAHIMQQPIRYRRAYYRGATLENRDPRGYTWELRCGKNTMQGQIAADGLVTFRPRGYGYIACRIRLQQGGKAIPLVGQGNLLIRQGRLFRQPHITVVYPPIARRGSQSLFAPSYHKQWAIAAQASSQYGTTSWSAQQATGPANLKQCSDNSKAWATKQQNKGQEWLLLRYKTQVQAVGAILHINLNPGAVVAIEAKTGAGWTTVWQGQDPTRQTCPVKWAVMFQNPAQTDTLRIILDTKKVSGWNEIDAVQLVSR